MSITLTGLILFVTAVAVVLTGLVFFLHRGPKNLLISFLQNWVGSLFLVSGGVKMVDPLGTAYKMEQYFAEFEATFTDTWANFMAPLFPWLSEYAIGFSVFMIVLEMVLGTALLVGWRPKLTSRVLLAVLVFFTVLTGFTYLTGFVPNGVNFFSFSQWGEYVETNMRVTDCGCFGDFLKLEPRTSFLKDVVLLVPGFLFVFLYGKKHRLWTSGTRTALVGVSLVGTLLVCFASYVWDIPAFDFRPFKEGVNIREQKLAEEEAMGNVEILAFQLKNKASGTTVEVPYEQYMKEYKNYPKAEWETVRQIQTEPEIASTKISEFEVSDVSGADQTEAILSDPNYSFMVVAYKLDYENNPENVVVYDTTYVVDTVRVADAPAEAAPQLVRRVGGVNERQAVQNRYTFDADYLTRWTDRLNPTLNEAQAAGLNVYAISKYQNPDALEDFRHATQSAYPIYVADDILLKTIVRSNPGVLLLRNGAVIKKWHWRKLPPFSEIRAEYMR